MLTCVCFLRRCQEVADRLWAAGKKSDALHGDKEQQYRTRAVTAFQAGEVNLLCATVHAYT